MSLENNVYVVFNDGKRDFYKAKSFGKTVNVFDSGYDNQYRNTDVMVEHIKEKLEYYMDEDYILIVGEPLLCALVINVAIELSESKRVRMLRWDKFLMNYHPVEVDFSCVKQTQKDFGI